MLHRWREAQLEKSLRVARRVHACKLDPPVQKEILEKIAYMLCLRRPALVEHQDVLVHGDLHEGDDMTFGARIRVRGVLQVEAHEHVLLSREPSLVHVEDPLQGTVVVGVHHIQPGAIRGLGTLKLRCWMSGGHGGYSRRVGTMDRWETRN